MLDEAAAWPRISVVTPSLNQGCFLDQCIRSVLDQHYPNLEYLIVDGGSTDASVDIIKQHARSLSWWVSEPDAGQSDGINKGLRRATGELVAWLNADDYYLPGALQAAAEAYHRKPGASFYFGNGLRVNRSGEPQASFFADNQVRFHRPALVWGLNTILQPAAFMQRTFLSRAGYLDTNLHYGMDSDLWLKLSDLAPPEVIQTTLAASREYGDTKTSKGSFGRVEELRQIAAKYSGCAHTPGSLAYGLDTLRRLALERPDVFPDWFISDLDRFWSSVNQLYGRFGAGPDGFPLPNPTEAGAPIVPNSGIASAASASFGAAKMRGGKRRILRRLGSKVKRLVCSWCGPRQAG